MVEHTLRTVHESLVQGYCATADCATGDCARLRDKRYYCTTGKEKNTTSYARNIGTLTLCLILKFNTIKYKINMSNTALFNTYFNCDGNVVLANNLLMHLVLCQ